MKEFDHIFKWMAFGLGVVFLMLSLTACIQFKKTSLYDGQLVRPPEPKPESIEKVVSPVLFEDDTLDVWGIVEDSCKTFSLVSDVSYQGEKALRLKWNRQGCPFVGFGMGWDSYAGKDLTPLMDYAAFEMYVRSVEGKIYGLPMVFTLEDYSGNMSFAYTANKYFERVAIDEDWQRVAVPLNAFDDEGVGIDYGNIKQLQVELQQAGEVYVDEVKLVFYEEEPQEPWLRIKQLPSPTALPQTLFDEGFANGNGWGLFTDSCQSVQMTREEKFKGSQSLRISWDYKEGCEWLAFGVNWNKWKPIDMSPIMNKAVLEFYLKSDNPAQLDFSIVLEEFDGPGLVAVDWKEDYVGKAENGWSKVSIPLQDFSGEVNLKNIQHLVFNLKGQEGLFYMDQMKLVQK